MEPKEITVANITIKPDAGGELNAIEAIALNSASICELLVAINGQNEKIIEQNEDIKGLLIRISHDHDEPQH